MDRKEEVLHKFGQHLAALRQQQGMSVAALAAAAGLKEDQLLRIEAGRVNLLFTTIIALARGLGLSPDTLLETVSPGK